jgi:sugar (pentulose or hexulose) kinase
MSTYREELSMADQRYVVGLDNGTTGVKAKIYDLEGNIVSEG